MTREEWKAWAMSLKPGDKVIVKRWNSLDIATVEKVPPTGRINTDLGVFYQDNCTDSYAGYGKTYGDLAPVTPDLIAEAERQEREEAEYQRKNQVIRYAKQCALQIGNGLTSISYEMAADLIALVKKYKGD